MVMMVCICQDCSLFSPLSLSLSLSFCLSSSPHIKQMKKWRRNEWMKLKCVCRRSLPHTSQLRMEERIFFFYVCGETENNEHHCLDSMKWWCMKIVLIRPLCERIWCVCVCLGASQSSSADDICWESAKFSARKYRRLSLNLLDFMNAFAVYHSNVREVWISLRR